MYQDFNTVKAFKQIRKRQRSETFKGINYLSQEAISPEIRKLMKQKREGFQTGGVKYPDGDKNDGDYCEE